MIYTLPKKAFDSLAGHLDHEVSFVGYGKYGEPPWQILALECEDCSCVLAEWRPKEKVRRRTRRGAKS